MADEADEAKAEMYALIDNICREIGPRPSGSKEEAKAAEFLQNELSGYCDEAWIDKFVCHPKVYRASFVIPPILYGAAVATYLINPIFSMIFTGIAILIIYKVVMFNSEFMDSLFPKAESTNVIAKISPENEKKNTIIIGAHHDSNYEFPILKKHRKNFIVFASIPVLSNAAMFLFSIVMAILSFASVKIPVVVNIALLSVFAALAVPALFIGLNTVSKIPVQGANDNLTACAVLLQMAKKLGKNRPKNTEVWFVSFGCEEMGIRGSKNFVAKYGEQLKNAAVFNMDMVGEKGCKLKIVTGEVNGMVKVSPEAVERIENIFGKLGISHLKGQTPAFTDSMAFSMQGIKAASIMALDSRGFAKYYHTVDDTPDKLDMDLVYDALRVCEEYVKEADLGNSYI
jgi:hypothetical protein